jgi:hypothetical protein
MLWVNLGLRGLIVGVTLVAISIRVPELIPTGRIVALLALQMSGVLVVTWFGCPSPARALRTEQTPPGLHRRLSP